MFSCSLCIKKRPDRVLASEEDNSTKLDLCIPCVYDWEGNVKFIKGKSYFKCLLCHIIYHISKAMSEHGFLCKVCAESQKGELFLQKHYICKICKSMKLKVNQPFKNIKACLKCLEELFSEHSLATIGDKEYFICDKCHKIYPKSDKHVIKKDKYFCKNCQN